MAAGVSVKEMDASGQLVLIFVQFFLAGSGAEGRAAALPRPGLAAAEQRADQPGARPLLGAIAPGVAL